MEGFDPRNSFGYEVSKRYDAVDAPRDEDETVAFLAHLAGQRGALEFAVGTGRIALPLTRAGVPVDGIEMSQDMIDRMREKPDGDRVNVIIGDMARVDTGRRYGLVYLVYNTIGNLLTQDDQVRCFENAARHLDDGAAFVLECRVPTAPTRPGLQYVDPERVAVDHVWLDVCRYDPGHPAPRHESRPHQRGRHHPQPDQPTPGLPSRVRPHGADRGTPTSPEIGRVEW